MPGATPHPRSNRGRCPPPSRAPRPNPPNGPGRASGRARPRARRTRRNGPRAAPRARRPAPHPKPPALPGRVRPSPPRASGPAGPLVPRSRALPEPSRLPGAAEGLLRPVWAASRAPWGRVSRESGVETGLPVGDGEFRAPPRLFELSVSRLFSTVVVTRSDHRNTS
ncbi:hypothetical protein CDG81_02260 [Actinopolyspora erythraea]|uniref:Uncharacterized protein n=1 Tax=Actinopolyspora erythraea TaxID=414996 RepID=A0A223RN69_9ACTN|nr:hypothetical protein CDG81_02260 [Actinopolyspora erythraea]